MADQGNRVAGTINVQSNGFVWNAVGNFTFNLGQPKREMLVGPDRIHGYKEMPQAPSISGEVRDDKNVDIQNELLNLKDATITLIAANGKTYLFELATYTGDGNGETEEGKFQFEAQAQSAEEIAP